MERDQAAAAAPALASALGADMPPPVDVVVVHDPSLAARAADLAPLVLAGQGVNIERFVVNPATGTPAPSAPSSTVAPATSVDIRRLLHHNIVRSTGVSPASAVEPVAGKGRGGSCEL